MKTNGCLDYDWIHKKNELVIINHVGEIHIHNNDAKRPQGEIIWIPLMCGTAV